VLRDHTSPRNHERRDLGNVGSIVALALGCISCGAFIGRLRWLLLMSQPEPMCHEANADSLPTTGCSVITVFTEADCHPDHSVRRLVAFVLVLALALSTSGFAFVSRTRLRSASF
jgi:hypothetical protein